MGMTDFLFTSESVTEGHPDKVADQISDAVLDGIIGQDPQARVACETMVTTGMAIIAGEITTKCYVDMPGIVRAMIKEIGYNDILCEKLPTWYILPTTLYSFFAVQHPYLCDMSWVYSSKINRKLVCR